MNLVVIESPNKRESISKYLGPGYKVLATKGHIVDLPKKDLGVDVDNGFEPTYVVSPDKRKELDAIKEAASKADEIFIATDPDREGEAIGWHVYLNLKKADQKKVKRAMFNSITKAEVQRAIANPTELDRNLFDAQQARRVTDRLVGYKVSGVMQFSGGLRGTSAGRVQSVALKYVAEREREIQAFVPKEYWEIESVLEWLTKHFAAKYQGELPNEAAARVIEKAIDGKEWKVVDVEENETSSKPGAPFTTSTLQQAGVNRLGWTGKRVMDVAQRLFEMGAITYHRTDSLTAAPQYIEKARQEAAKYGAKYVPASPITYKSKAKNAQEAHECIRPTFDKLPDGGDEARLYDLIRRRFIASQMAPAQFKTVSVTLDCAGHKFIAKGRTMLFDGYQKVWGGESDDVILPPLKVGDKPTHKNTETSQHFTKAPARYTDSSIIQQLERDGVGRPSTYVTIIERLVYREYIKLDKKSYSATPLGLEVYDYLSKHFPDVVNPETTAALEEKLDDIESGKDWKEIIAEWYGPFEQSLKEAKKSKVGAAPIEGMSCPKCGKNVVQRRSRFGPFLACEDAKGCKTIIKTDKDGKVKDTSSEETDYKCYKCKKPMLKKNGRFGEFLACSGYPKCKETRGVPLGSCPSCDKGSIVQKYAPKKKKHFYACDQYPKCDYASDNAP